MKSNIVNGKIYNRLLRRLFFQTIAVLVLAAILAISLRSMLKGKVADHLVYFISIFSGVDRDSALMIYWYYFRNNMDIIIGIVIAVLFLILFRLSASLFTRYFDQMVAGVDKLTAESDEDIVMTPELAFMEVKLNEVKDRLKKRAKEAQSAEQRKNELVVYLAHDIKTPLTSVIGYLSLLDEASDMPADKKAKYVHIALEKAYRLDTLMNEFFEITRYNLQSMPLNKKDINLCYMMVQLTDELYPQLAAHKKNIKINIEETINIRGDSEKLARVFNNILKNAIAYSDDNSIINISAQERTDEVIIRFENQGGIPKEKLNSIFEKFYRLDSSRSSTTGGSGLGLAIAKDIITLHGGTIKAQSDNLFTLFTVKLPKTPTADIP
ncbi:two-component system, OmpR family, sensor histidine kinase VanS [Anaerocolumna xylanovorans DSM 12503]|uniref:histidine kinase n=1 Tax=Anaerocolumna xylanovorans DSM 12503 TaxID=1121345 RepID=A0A1M7Y3W1_9FIRM|nr:HAMP domain-containing sensor histidine kinase [Anaerocolumna xylanovorans]SHO46923.1 two-component system, OmpR family, sensor histidine kinase VanS [Anaerocolumna xylanovorans DSM 12503]